MQRHAETLTNSPNIIKGSLYAIFAFFCMAVFGVLTKITTELGHYIWVSFITYLAATFIISLLILPRGLSALKSEHYSLLITRAVLGTMASFLYMLSMHFIPIVNSTLLFNTAPIFIPLLTLLVFHMPVQKTIWYAVLIGFIGILVIIKPNQSIFTEPGNLIGLASGFALAIAYLTMKILTSTDSGLRIIFYYAGIGTLMQIPLLFFAPALPNVDCIIHSCLCGAVLVFAQVGLVKAYRYATASQVGVYQYSSVVFVAIFEWLLWSISPGMLDYLGFALVSIAGIYIIRGHS